MVFTDSEDDDLDAAHVRRVQSQNVSLAKKLDNDLAALSEPTPDALSGSEASSSAIPNDGQDPRMRTCSILALTKEDLHLSADEELERLENDWEQGHQDANDKRPSKSKKTRGATRKIPDMVDKRLPSSKTRKTKATMGSGGQGTRRKRRKVRDYDDSDDEQDLMESILPDYIMQRRAKFDERFRQLKDGGLALPPTYDAIEFSDDERLQDFKEKPEFPLSTATRGYQDIAMPNSLGLIPASIAQFLRDYQVDGVKFLHELFVYQKGGILGDDMGLGKTVQVIAFLTAAYGKTGDERDKKRMRKMTRLGQQYPKTLIICPGTLMENWKDEFRRWGWWYVDLYHGGAMQRHDVFLQAQANMLEVMITTYHTYRANKDEINMINWNCVVADECHMIKERKSETAIAMNEINALCRIGLTGTAIQNKYEELWTLLNWTNPGKLGPISTWKEKICVPLKLGQSHNATQYELATARKTAKSLVQHLLPRFFLRRTKVLLKDQLPKKSDRVVFCPLTSTQAQAYQNFLNGDIVRTIKQAAEPCDCATEGRRKKKGWCCYMTLDDGSPWQSWVFPALSRLRDLSNHLALLIPHGTDPQEKQAKDLDMLMITLPNVWKEIQRTRDSIMHTANPDYCGKWRVLKRLLTFWHDQGRNKVLIFSHSVRLLKMLQNLFISTKFNVKYLDGSMAYEERYAAVQEFNTDPTQFAFLISTRAGGVGLNITSANKVVVVDPNWNPSYDLQAQDRAYRIGQTRDVEVFRLISQGTMEEIVYARQIYKQQQANIGYNATSERRYFRGVQDRADQKGEIFGLKNLFAFQGEAHVLRDIVNKTNIAESKADVRVANLDIEEHESGAEGDEESIKAESGQRIKLETGSEDVALSQLVAEIVCEDGSASRGRSKTPSGSSRPAIKKHDPIQAILSSVGVSYTHENSEVVGSSKVEALLSKRAEEAAAGTRRWGMQEQKAKVFVDEPSQDLRSDEEEDLYENVYDNALHEKNRDGFVTPDGGIKYKYRPPHAVRRRQFCSMARWAGYGEDVVTFALVVENWTQAERRECLARFYQYRRDVLRGVVDQERLNVEGTDSGFKMVNMKVETPALRSGGETISIKAEAVANTKEEGDAKVVEMETASEDEEVEL